MGNAGSSTSGTGAAAAFPATQWSVVLAAGTSETPQSRAAFDELCRKYWYPLYVFARRSGRSVEESEDLTQEYFVRLLGKQMLCGLKREGGKFRSFLLSTFKCFLINEWHRDHSQKRGGGTAAIPIDESAEARYRELLVEATPEALFEREWAWTILGRVTARLKEEWSAAGKATLFECLRGFLTGGERVLSYGEIGARLQMNEPAVRMAVHRLRRRYGEVMREEIAATVSNADEIDEEIRHLIAVIGQP